MQFKVIGEITHIETIAVGRGIRILAFLNKRHGMGRWRKRKGIARVETESGEIRWAELHWYEARGIGRRELRIKRAFSTSMNAQTKTATRFVVCVRNDEYPASLELHKIYEVLPDAEGARLGFIRVIDESGEDYLFPQVYFLDVEVSRQVEQALRRAS